jgi:hypothetical protein
MSDEDISGLPPAQAEESGSLEDHEAAFGPGGTGEAPDAPDPAPVAEAKADPAPDAADRDDQGRFKSPRHRAKSQQASPEDVPRIRDLTAKLRAAEAERDALKNAKPPVSTPQAPSATAQAPSSQAQAPSAAPQSPAQPWTPPATRPKPSEDEIGEKYKTYADFTEDLSDWVGEQRDAKREAKQQQDKQQQQYRDWTAQYTTALADAKTRYPDYDAQVSQADAVMQAQQIAIPQVLMDAVLSSSRGPDLSYYLATHQDDYRDLIRDAWAVNHPNSIAMVRRVLESKLPVASAQRAPNGSDAAAGTGSALRSPHIVPAPRPPNPVRTGPQKIGDEAPDDDSSLDAHEAHYYKRR